jgi:hypothetical protein
METLKSLSDTGITKKNILLLQEVKEDNKRSRACFSKLSEWLAPVVGSKKNDDTKQELKVIPGSVSEWIQRLVEEEYLVGLVKSNNYEGVKEKNSGRKSFARDAECNSLMQILLQAPLKPSLPLVKHLIPFTRFTHVNLHKKTVLDYLDLSNTNHQECAPYLIDVCYQYVKRLPQFNEDNLDYPAYSARQNFKPGDEKTEQMEKMKQKYKIAKKYLDMIKEC